MKRILRRKPSAAMLVAITALVSSLAGPAIAQQAQVALKFKKSDGKKIIKIIGKDKLTGTQIKESTLKQVPSALNADHATNADKAKLADLATLATNATNAVNATNATNATNAANAANAANADKVGGKSAGDFAPAGSVDGVEKRFFFARNGTVGDTTVLSLGGLQLVASCAPGQELTVTAHTTVDNAEIHAVANEGTSSFVLDGDNFDTTGSEDILDNADTSSDSTAGYLSYATPAGNVVTATYQAEEGAFGSPQDADCLFSGIAFGG